VNISRKLNGKFDPNHQYKIDVAIPVDKLITIDPVKTILPGTGFPQPVVVLNGITNVQNNVSQFKNYYQRKGGSTAMPVYYHNTLNSVFPVLIFNEPYNPAFGGLVGSDAISSAAPKTSVNVTTSRAGVYATNVDYVLQEDLASLYGDVTHYDGGIKGSGVQHDTIVWYVLQDALNDLQ
jgi:hypothetical protein